MALPECHTIHSSACCLDFTSETIQVNISHEENSRWNNEALPKCAVLNARGHDAPFGFPSLCLAASNPGAQKPNIEESPSCLHISERFSNQGRESISNTFGSSN